MDKTAGSTPQRTGVGPGRPPVRRKALWRTVEAVIVTATIDILKPQAPKRVAIVASNSSVSQQTGWPIGYWWSELTHPYWEFSEKGYKVDVYSPDGGPRQIQNLVAPAGPFYAER